MYHQAHQLYLFLFHGNAILTDFYRKLDACHLIYHCVKGDDCLDIQFSGMDHVHAEIFNFPLQAHFVTACNSFQVQGLIKGKLCRQAADFLVLFPHIEHIRVQVSADKSLAFAKAHLVHDNIAFALDQPSHIRLCVRHIVIRVKGYLAGCPAFYMKHLYTFFS